MSAPIADFNFKPAYGLPPLFVQFKDKSTGSPTSWAWRFDDGNGAVGTSSEQDPLHVFNLPLGPRWLELTVTNADGSNTKRIEANTYPGCVLLTKSPTR